MQNSDNNSSNSNKIKIVGALLVGAIVGTAAGILFAPAKGSKTRSKIAKGVRDLAGDFKEKLIEEASALRDKADELESLAKEKVEELKNNLKQKVDGVKNLN
jgi:gas vesicle protein